MNPKDLLCSACGESLLGQHEDSSVFTEDRYCILSCDCSEYPVVAGIPVLHAAAVPDTHTNRQELVEHIKSGRFGDALLAAVTPQHFPKRRRRPDRLFPPFVRRRRVAGRAAVVVEEWRHGFRTLADATGEGSTRRLFEHYFGAAKNIADYFSYRWGQPKLLASISIASLAPANAGPALDLGCGAGHLTRYLQARNAGHGAVGVDAHFFLLWMAKTRVSPESFFVCADAQDGIPFADRSFGNIVLSNFLQFLRAKKACVREVERVTTDDGVIGVTSIRHSRMPAVTPNQAVSPATYRKLFSMPHVAVAEAGLLQRYLGGHGPDLRESSDAKHLDESPIIAIVVSRLESVFSDHDQIDTLPAESYGSLSLNPLYVRVGDSSAHTYERRWPSDFYLHDNETIESYLPGAVRLSEQEWQALIGNDWVSDADLLVRLGVLVPLLDDY